MQYRKRELGVDNVSKLNCVRTEGEAKANLV